MVVSVDVISARKTAIAAYPPHPSKGAPLHHLQSEIRALTGLRGIAALLVAIYHFYPEHLLPPGALRAAVSKGYLWVDLFFILSGFLMAMNYAHLFAGRWSIRAWLDFLLKRLARIYPLYLVIVLATLAYTVGTYGSFAGGKALPAVNLSNPAVEIAANVLMIQSWSIARSIDGVAWSLSTEWAAYLLFPLLSWLALFARLRTALTTAFVAVAVVTGTAFLTMHDGAYHSGPLDAYDGTTVQPILRCLGGFTLGLLTFRMAQSPRVMGLASRDTIAVVALALLASGFAMGAHDLLVYPLFTVIVLALYGNRGWPGRIFGCRPVHGLGLVSYSLYLLHLYFVGPRQWFASWYHVRLPETWASWATDVTAFAALLATSFLTYRIIEEPGRRGMRRINQAVAAMIRTERPNTRHQA